MVRAESRAARVMVLGKEGAGAHECPHDAGNDQQENQNSERAVPEKGHVARMVGLNISNLAGDEKDDHQSDR